MRCSRPWPLANRQALGRAAFLLGTQVASRPGRPRPGRSLRSPTTTGGSDCLRAGTPSCPRGQHRRFRRIAGRPEISVLVREEIAAAAGTSGARLGTHAAAVQNQEHSARAARAAAVTKSARRGGFAMDISERTLADVGPIIALLLGSEGCELRSGVRRGRSRPTRSPLGVRQCAARSGGLQRS